MLAAEPTPEEARKELERRRAAKNGQSIGAPIDMTRPRIDNPDGSFSTEETITIDMDGRFFNIPTIVNGKRVGEDDAVALFRSGENKAVGEFGSLDEAVSAAQSRTNEIGRVRGPQITPEQARAELERRRGAVAQPDQTEAPESANPVQEFLLDASEASYTQSGNSLADNIIRGAAGAAARPVQTAKGVFEEIAYAPSRAIDELVGKPLRGEIGSPLKAATDIGNTALLLTPATAGARGVTAGATTAAKSVPKSVRTAVTRLQEADPALAQNARNVIRLREEGVPATVADLTTRQGQSRLKGAARRDGPAQGLAQDAFDPRQADQSARLTSTIEEAFGVEGDFLGRVRQIGDTKRTHAEPLYREAYAAPTALTPKLVELVRRPPLQKALKDAEELAAIDGVQLAKAGGSDIPAVRVTSPSGASRLEGDTARLHYMRRALDDQIDAYKDKVTGKLSTSPRAQALIRLRKQFNEAIREANPAFAKADAVWSEGTAAEQAMERGLKAASMRTERQVRQLMDDAIREGDQEFFELGFAQGLVEKIGGSGSDMANQTLKLLSPQNQKITRTVLGEERGESLLNRLRVENLMSRTRNKISPNVGSDTAENLQQSASQAVSMIADVLSGNIVRAGAQGLRIAGQKRLSEQMIRTQQEVDEQLIRLATEDPEELLRLIQEINAARAPKQIQLPDLRGAGSAAGVSAIPDQTARERRQSNRRAQ